MGVVYRLQTETTNTYDIDLDECKAAHPDRWEAMEDDIPGFVRWCFLHSGTVFFDHVGDSPGDIQIDKKVDVVDGWVDEDEGGRQST